MESQRSAVLRVEESKEVDKILDEIPTEHVVNPHIDSIKKRRSSLRRSVNGGFSSTLRGNVFLILATYTNDFYNDFWFA